MLLDLFLLVVHVLFGAVRVSEDCWLRDSLLLSSAVLLWCDVLRLSHSLVSPAGCFHVTLQSESRDWNNTERAEAQTDSWPVLHFYCTSVCTWLPCEANTALGVVVKPLREDAEGVSSCAEPPAVQCAIAWKLSHFPMSAPAPAPPTLISIVTMYEQISVKTAECRSKQRWRPLARCKVCTLRSLREMFSKIRTISACVFHIWDNTTAEITCLPLC